MIKKLPPCFSNTLVLTGIVSLVAVHAATAQVLPLDFVDGNGAAFVDQYQGISGSGWTTGWVSSFGGGTSAASASVTNTLPITSGGDYLHVTYDTAASGDRSARVSRQWDTSGASISLAAPINISFNFRSDTVIAGAAQGFVIFGSSAATSSTGGNDSWKFTLDGGGISVYNDNTLTALASAAQAGTNVAGTPLKFSLLIDPTANTYIASVTRLDTNVTFTSGILTLRNGADASLSYLNFVALGGASMSGLGYSIDNITVVPEPSAFVYLGLAGLGAMFLIFRRRIRA